MLNFGGVDDSDNFLSWAWFGMSYTRHTNILHMKTWISRLMLQIKSCARNMKCEKEKHAALETEFSFLWFALRVIFYFLIRFNFGVFFRSCFQPLEEATLIPWTWIHPLKCLVVVVGLTAPSTNPRSSNLIRMARTSSAAPPCPTSTGCPQGQSEHGQSVLIHLTDVQATMLQGIVDWFFVTGSVELNEAITANFCENLCPYDRKRCL